MFNSGNKVQYFLFMEQKYGREVIDQLLRQNNETRKYTVDDFNQITAQYKAKFAEIDK